MVQPGMQQGMMQSGVQQGMMQPGMVQTGMQAILNLRECSNLECKAILNRE